MATRKTTSKADDLADTVQATGRRASAGARKAGASIDRAADDGAARVRRAARRSAEVYDETAEEFGERVGSLEDTIRQNPLAAAGAALLIGVVLGRFIL